MTAPHVVYFGQTPDLGTGSPIILLRHLRRLTANGWKVSVSAKVGRPQTTPKVGRSFT